MLYFFLIHSISRLLLELLTNDFRIVASSFQRVNFLKTLQIPAESFGQANAAIVVELLRQDDGQTRAGPGVNAIKLSFFATCIAAK
jgi:hypothetical protein